MKYITVKEAAEQWDISERMVRKYCDQGKIEGAIHADNLWVIPMDAERPNNADRSSDPKSLANKVAYQRSKNNHFGIYEYLQVNLAYSSSRMASNRLTRDQVIEIYRTGKVSVAFEPMKIDDVVEIANHFRAGQYIVDTITEPINTIWFRKLHHKLLRGTRADQEGTLHIGEYRTTPDKFGVDATTIPAALSALITEYESKKQITLYDILDFHARFEAIHPFGDGNGRVGRMLMVKECLHHDIMPFIIDDKRRSRYLRGIKEWHDDRYELVDVVMEAQGRFEAQIELQKLCAHTRLYLPADYTED